MCACVCMYNVCMCVCLYDSMHVICCICMCKKNNKDNIDFLDICSAMLRHEIGLCKSGL
jgi:hypothetical protein